MQIYFTKQKLWKQNKTYKNYESHSDLHLFTYLFVVLVVVCVLKTLKTKQEKNLHKNLCIQKYLKSLNNNNKKRKNSEKNYHFKLYFRLKRIKSKVTSPSSDFSHVVNNSKGHMFALKYLSLSNKRLRLRIQVLLKPVNIDSFTHLH